MGTLPPVTDEVRHRTEELRRALGEAGFDEVRFARLDPLNGAHMRSWLAEGMHAEMDWMARTVEKRLDPNQVLEGARSIVILGVNYWRGEWRWKERRPLWARYVLHEDYHDTIKAGLTQAGKIIESVCGGGAGDYRYYVDTGPVLERAWAARSGVGFQGKNGMMISRRFGNWLFLATILTRHELVQDPAVSLHAHEGPGALCGKCTRCMEACPTMAIPSPGVVDARRCLSYHTIENKGIIPREFRAAVGDRIYGCDICLEVCPWNRFAQQARDVLLSVRGDIAHLSLSDVLTLTPESFAAYFRKTAVKRLKLPGLLRNACVVAGNQPLAQRENLVPQLIALAKHGSATVRVHAVWAVYRLLGKSLAGTALSEIKSSETDALVLEEYAWWGRLDGG